MTTWQDVRVWYENHGFINVAANLQEIKKDWSPEELLEALLKGEGKKS